MKRNLIIAVIACGAALTLCPTVHAQGGGGGGGGGGGRRGGGMNIERLTTALSLTPDEVKAITPILDQEKTDMQALRSDTTTAQADKMAKFKEIRDAANGKINAILTPDQQTKFAAMQARMHGGRHGQGGGGGGAGGGDAASPAPTTSGS